MKLKKTRFLTCALLAAAPVVVSAFSTGPPPARTNVPGDGGLNCTACHRTFAPANSDPLGKLVVTAAAYTPGAKQKIHLHMEHPTALRWGFQVTARAVSDDTKMAGTFTVTDSVRVRCFDGVTDSPCNGQREFASHFRDDARGLDSTNRGKAGGADIDVEWTAPATDVGGVMIYVSGNMANNDGTNNGDRIYTTKIRIDPVCSMTGKPAVTGVVNGASFLPGISAGAIVSLFGSGFGVKGSSRAAGPEDFDGGKFPSALGCVAVEIGGQRAPITFVGDSQINAQVPSLTAVGPVEVRVIANPGAPNEVRGDALAQVSVQAYSPGLFTLNGKSLAALFPSGAAAKPGDIVSVFGTGFGSTTPVVQPGELAGAVAGLRVPVTVVAGGVTLQQTDVLYAGLSPGSIGALYQFNIRIPDNAPDGDLPLTVSVNGQSSQAGTTIPVKR